jgi:hypothetical protein
MNLKYKIKSLILTLDNKLSKFVGDNARLSGSSLRKGMNFTQTMCYLEVRE